MMKKRLLYLGGVACLVVLSLAGHLLYLYTHREFGPSDFRYAYELAKDGVASDDSLRAEAKAALNQPFFYLGFGRQMTAFVSQDGRYVMKFFNPRAALKERSFHRWDKLLRLCSPRWLSHAYLKRKARISKLAHCYQMGFEELREEAGLVYVHLNSVTRLSQALELTDKQGQMHYLNLDTCPFVLQKRAEIAADVLNQLLAKGDIVGAQQRIKQIGDLFTRRAQKGYTDRIQTLHNNFGFVDGRAVQIDLGKIRKEKSVQETPKQEIDRVFGRLNQFLSKNYPQL